MTMLWIAVVVTGLTIYLVAVRPVLRRLGVVRR
jgi:hypothetical protein